VHLDLAGGHCRIAPDLGTDADVAFDQDDGLGADRRGPRDDIRRAPARVEGELHQAGPVAQIEKDQAAKIAAPVYPAAETNSLARVVTGQGSTEVRAVCGGRHAAVSLRSREGGGAPRLRET
jgi:hypothetical protein